MSEISSDVLVERLNKSIDELLKEDDYLIRHNLSERAITHRLAVHLQALFPDYLVDCEYNKFDSDSKDIKIDRDYLSARLMKKYKERIDDLDPAALLELSTYPDIIVHRRGKDGPNLLVVEVKKQHGEPDQLDRLKLEFYTSPEAEYQYQRGAAVMIRTNKDAHTQEAVENFKVETPKIVWFENGQLL